MDLVPPADLPEGKMEIDAMNQHVGYNEIEVTLWLFNIAMENPL